MVNKNSLSVHKNTFKKSAKKTNKKKQWKRLQSLADSKDKKSFFGRFLSPHFQKQFSLNFFFFFFFFFLF